MATRAIAGDRTAHAFRTPLGDNWPSIHLHDAIAFANQPAACRIDRHHPSHRDQGRDGQARFRFNQMDTVPYWFAPLGWVFGIAVSKLRPWQRIGSSINSTRDHTVRADRPKLPNRYGHHTLQRSRISAASRKLSDILEWHAMFLVAGELADSRTPTVVPDYQQPEDPWNEWLNRFLDLTNGSWISDHRGPVPPGHHRHALNPPRETWRRVSNADFDRELLVGDTLVVSASIDKSHGSLYENHHPGLCAWSAHESAESLLASLQDTPSSLRRPLPAENDPHDREINEPGFQLKGWLADMNHDNTHLEDHNPLRRIRLRTVQPGRDFQKTLPNTHTAKEWKTSTHTHPGPVTLLRWSDQPINWPAHSRPRYTEGRQTLVRIQELLAFLSRCWQGHHSHGESFTTLRIPLQTDRRRRTGRTL